MVRSVRNGMTSAASWPVRVQVIIGQAEKEALGNFLTEALSGRHLKDLGKKQPDLTGFESVLISDNRAVDGDRLVAWFKRSATDKISQVYAEVTQAGMAGPDTVGPYWYGPGFPTINQ